jgi:hypothetical protein
VPRRPRKTAGEIALLKTVNAVGLRASELMEFVAECQRHRQDGGDPFVRQSFIAVKMADNDSARASAFIFRANGLAAFVSEGEGAPGWTIKTDDDGVFASDCLFAAAVTEPMVIGPDGQLTFEREPFLRRVLELSEPEIRRQ